jgi:hypothetical protein
MTMGKIIISATSQIMVVHTHCVNGTLQLNTTTTHHAAMHIVECECWIMDVSNTPTLMHTIVFEGFHT